MASKDYPSINGLLSLADNMVYILKLAKEITHKLKSIDIEEEMNNMVDDVQDECENYKSEKIAEIIRTLYKETLNDCQKILSEANPFCECILNCTYPDVEKCQFFAEIWAGDAYDKEGYESIKELRKELELKNNTSSYDGLVRRTVIYLKNSR